MKIPSLTSTRHETPQLSYAECDRGYLDTSTDSDMDIIIHSNSTSCATTNSHENKKRRAILIKLIRGMIKTKKDKVAYKNLLSDSDNTNHRLDQDASSSSQSQQDRSQEGSEGGSFPTFAVELGKMQDEEQTVASTPMNQTSEADEDVSSSALQDTTTDGSSPISHLTPNRRNGSDIEKTNDDDHLTPEEDALLQNQVTPRKSNARILPGDRLTVEQCLMDIRNLEISNIKQDVGLIYAGAGEVVDMRNEEDEINRKLFFEDTPPSAIQKNYTFEGDDEGSTKETPQVAQDGNCKHGGISKVEMRDLWGAAKDVMKALDFYDTLKAPNLADKGEFIKEALKKYNLQGCAVDEVVQDVIGGENSNNHPPKEILIQDKKYIVNKKSLKTGSEVSSEIGTELKYRTPKRGTKTKQTTLILPSGEKENCEILTASPLTAIGTNIGSNSEMKEFLDDSGDVFDLGCLEKSIDVPMKVSDTLQTNDEIFSSVGTFDNEFSTFDRDLAVAPSRVDSKMVEEVSAFPLFDNENVPTQVCDERERSEFMLFSPFRKDMESFSAKELVPEYIEDRKSVHDNDDDETSLSHDDGVLNSEEGLTDSQEYHSDDEMSSFQEHEFPSPNWKADYNPPIQRKLNFDSPLMLQCKEEFGLKKSGIFTDANSVLSSLENISLEISKRKGRKIVEGEMPIGESSRNGVCIEELLQRMREDCVHRLDNNIMKVSGLETQEAHKGESSQPPIPLEEGGHSVDSNQTCSSSSDVEYESSELDHPISSLSADKKQSTQVVLMDFKDEDMVPDISEKEPSTIKLDPLSKIHSPSLQAQQDIHVSNGSKIPVGEFQNGGNSPKRTCNRVSLTISDRIAELQKKFQVV